MNFKDKKTQIILALLALGVLVFLIKDKLKGMLGMGSEEDPMIGGLLPADSMPEPTPEEIKAKEAEEAAAAAAAKKEAERLAVLAKYEGHYIKTADNNTIWDVKDGFRIGVGSWEAFTKASTARYGKVHFKVIPATEMALIPLKK